MLAPNAGIGEGRLELEDKVAIVTGAARNIGRAIALDLASAGAAVVVNARSAAGDADGVVREIEAAGGRALAILADVRDEAAVAQMVETAVARFGGIDILVNNAAVRREAALDAIDAAAFRDIVSIILDGAYVCAKACLPHLRRSGAGAIVNIGGLTGSTGAKGRPHVVAAKAGLVGLVQTLAVEHGPHGITANAVAPGVIETPQALDPVNSLGPEALAAVAPQVPVRRVGQPEDIAHLFAFLASEEAGYVSGQLIVADGARSAAGL